MTGIIFIFLRGENDNSFGIVKILGRVFAYLAGCGGFEGRGGSAGFGGRAEPSNLCGRGGATEKRQTFFSEAEVFPALFSYIDMKSDIREELVMSESYELVKFVDGSFELEVNVSLEEDTVWLTQEQMAELFETTKQNISIHISNIYKEGELDSRTVKDFFTVRIEGIRKVKRSISIYNLDMIISVGFRVKSKRGITFRRWALGILRQYMLKGFAVEPSRVLVSRENYLDLVNVVNRIGSTQTDLIGRVERLEDK